MDSYMDETGDLSTESPFPVRTSPFQASTPKSSAARTPRRSRSLSSASVLEKFDNRMRYTRSYKLKMEKGNQMGTSIHGPFTTLEQVLKQLPLKVGVNLECKYPMIDECEREEMDILNVELNWWVDTSASQSLRANNSFESSIR